MTCQHCGQDENAAAHDNHDGIVGQHFHPYESPGNDDTAIALSLLIQNDIDAQRAIHDWEQYRQRNQAVLRDQVPSGETLATDAGTCGWEKRMGTIEYKAVIEHVVTRLKKMKIGAVDDHAQTLIDGLIESITEDINFFRKPETQSFFVRAELRQAPKPPEPDLTGLLQQSIDNVVALRGGAQ